jgi:hypothetical protein
MTDQEATKALQLKGYNDLRRAPIADQPGAYVLQNRSVDNKYHLTLCNGFVTGLSVDLGADFRDFVTQVEREKILRGEPVFRVKQVKDASLVWATWSMGNETFEYIFQWYIGDKKGEYAVNYSLTSACRK